MRNEVRVLLEDGQEFVHDFDSAEAMSNEDGRRWLDQEFLRMDCEPLRASGKVLIVDKVVVVAKAAGAQLLGDAQWLAQFARASVGAVGRPTVVVNTKAMTASF
ncbi:MAG: hypothetical protein RR749_03470 [Comamonas sp.]|jgi:hypothetical protein|uniref:hypothetical protein n=1 Tax=Comamonas sp. BIGb0152 TaxID=2940601 RepID=UPI002168DD63|nr:hypothetical protein [Comamonas sp. BIGb0152]MCS4292391.1 hypothetical protein [Comamonas sp. BIGb0152]